MPTRTLFGTIGNDTLALPDGRDPSVSYDWIVQGLGGNDTVAGGTGNDWIWGSANYPGIDYFTGGAGDDVLISYYGGSYTQPGGGTVVTTLDGGAGNDVLILGSHDGQRSGNALLLGGDGDDQLWASYGDLQRSLGSTEFAYLNGGAGNDLLVGGGFLTGGAGDDLVIVGGAVQGASPAPGDRFGIFRSFQGFGDDGNDTLYAAAGILNVFLNGDSAIFDPVLRTNTASTSRPGADTLVGNGQNDTLNGGEGPSGGDGRVDVLIGAQGRDNFVLTSSAATPAADLLWNFELGLDRVSDAYSGDSGRGWAGASTAYFDAYAAPQPNGALAALSGTMLYGSDGTALGFFVGQNLTLPQLLAGGALT